MLTSLTGMEVARTGLSSVSNDLANANTNGFKSGVTRFADIYGQATPFEVSRTLTGKGAVAAGSSQEHTQGSVLTTGNVTDLAIAGDAFFAVQPRPTSYAIEVDAASTALTDVTVNASSPILGISDNGAGFGTGTLDFTVNGRAVSLDLSGLASAADVSAALKEAIETTIEGVSVTDNGDGSVTFETSQGGLTYSRDGQLTIDAEGYLINKNGDVVLDTTRQPVQIPELSVDRVRDAYSAVAGGLSLTEGTDYADATFIMRAPVQGEGAYSYEVSATPATGRGEISFLDDGSIALGNGLAGVNGNPGYTLIGTVTSTDQFGVEQLEAGAINVRLTPPTSWAMSRVDVEFTDPAAWTVSTERVDLGRGALAGFAPPQSSADYDAGIDPAAILADDAALFGGYEIALDPALMREPPAARPESQSPAPADTEIKLAFAPRIRDAAAPGAAGGWAFVAAETTAPEVAVQARYTLDLSGAGLPAGTPGTVDILFDPVADASARATTARLALIDAGVSADAFEITLVGSDLQIDFPDAANSVFSDTLTLPTSGTVDFTVGSTAYSASLSDTTNLATTAADLAAALATDFPQLRQNDDAGSVALETFSLSIAPNAAADTASELVPLLNAAVAASASGDWEGLRFERGPGNFAITARHPDPAFFTDLAMEYYWVDTFAAVGGAAAVQDHYALGAGAAIAPVGTLAPTVAASHADLAFGDVADYQGRALQLTLTPPDGSRPTRLSLDRLDAAATLEDLRDALNETLTSLGAPYTFEAVASDATRLRLTAASGQEPIDFRGFGLALSDRAPALSAAFDDLRGQNFRLEIGTPPPILTSPIEVAALASDADLLDAVNARLPQGFEAVANGTSLQINENGTPVSDLVIASTTPATLGFATGFPEIVATTGHPGGPSVTITPDAVSLSTGTAYFAGTPEKADGTALDSAFRGPSITSAPLALKANDEVSFDVSVADVAGSDSAALFAYLVDEAGNTQVIADAVAPGATVSARVAAEGTYRLVVVAGAVDPASDTDTTAQATIGVSNLAITGNDSDIDAALAARVLGALRFSDTRYQQLANAAPERAAKVEVYRTGPLAGAPGVTQTRLAETRSIAYSLDQSTVEEENLKVRVPFEQLNIDANGRVEVSFNSSTTVEVATIGVARFVDPKLLIYLGNGRYDGSGLGPSMSFGRINDINGGSIISGALEMSNVDTSETLTSLIMLQQQYSANARALQAYMEAARLVRDIR